MQGDPERRDRDRDLRAGRRHGAGVAGTAGTVAAVCGIIAAAGRLGRLRRAAFTRIRRFLDERPHPGKTDPDRMQDRHGARGRSFGRPVGGRRKLGVQMTERGIAAPAPTLTARIDGDPAAPRRHGRGEVRLRRARGIARAAGPGPGRKLAALPLRGTCAKAVWSRDGSGRMTEDGLSYAAAGVDIEAGNALVKRIGPAAHATARPGTMGALGGFGALFDLKAAGFADPVLVAATDGVGTKVKLAVETGRFGTIGQDLVAMCVNDLLCQGAEPLFFLDYFATGRLEVDVAAEVIEGIARACSAAGCALIGGETAELPGLYAPGDFDLAGFAVGAVERGRILPRRAEAGDVLLGVASDGLHSNGFSLVRRIVERAGLGWLDPAPWGGRSLGEEFLRPTRLYVRPALAAIAEGGVRGLAHITGGGITGNLPRILPEGLGAEVDLAAWTLPPEMAWLREAGGVGLAEMLGTFNCGIGLVVVVEPAWAEALALLFAEAGERVVAMGRVVPGAGVRYLGRFR